MNDLDSALGLASRALEIYARRSEVLAANIANADTPGYRAREIDFRSALNAARDDSAALAANRSHPAHFPAGAAMRGSGPGYRAAVQASLDGNSVDSAQERSEFAANAVRYQAALRFVDGRVKSILAAARGE